MSEIRVRYQGDASREEREAIIDGLVAYNREQGFTSSREPLSVVARDDDDDGRVVGGLLGEVNGGWLFVSALWVDPAARHAGVGSQLMREAEAETRRRGCVGIYLDTYSFQARPFYEGLGFRLFGELPNCPTGCSKYYLYKPVDPHSAP